MYSAAVKYVEMVWTYFTEDENIPVKKEYTSMYCEVEDVRPTGTPDNLETSLGRILLD